MLTRRRFVQATALLAAEAGLAAPPAATTGLRFSKVRYGTFLVELGTIRVLIDPCFEAGLGCGPLYDVAAPVDGPESLDLVLVTSARRSAFQPSALGALRARNTPVVVGDAALLSKVRYQGFWRARAVKAGDVVRVAGLEVRASPTGGEGVGFHLRAGGRTLWHTARASPLDVDDGPARFAGENAAEVLLACTEGLSGPGRSTAGPDDALLLGRLATARFLVPAYDDAPLTPLAALLWHRGAGTPPRPLAKAPRVVVAEPSRWYRVAPRAARERG
jgi:L-ascorbate metabolism protein UlaG (beta-lactamase superfamily)